MVKIGITECIVGWNQQQCKWKGRARWSPGTEGKRPAVAPLRRVFLPWKAQVMFGKKAFFFLSIIWWIGLIRKLN